MVQQKWMSLDNNETTRKKQPTKRMQGRKDGKRENNL